jgi:hypothetical protein
MVRDWQRLRDEVERVHRRYQIEVVEALLLCPWAKDAREAGRVHMCVTRIDRPDVSAALLAIDEAMADPRVEVGIVVFPALPLDRLPFQHFAAELRSSDAARHERGASRIALADFHPVANADSASPERLVPFLRRAPDPMLQVVRTSALEAVRLSDDQGTHFVDPSQHDLSALLSTVSTPSLATRVARNNARTVAQLGIAHVEALFDNILRDRNASYAALGLTVPCWV